MRHGVMFLVCVIVITGCASTTHEDKSVDAFEDRYNEFLERALTKRGYVDEFDIFMGKSLAKRGYFTPEKIEEIVQATKKSYYKRGLTYEDYKKEEEYTNKRIRESREQITKIAEEEKRARENALKSKLKVRESQPTYQYQPSYDPNFEINRLRDDLTIQSIIQRGEAEKREQEIRRLETEQSYRERTERAREQQRQIEQSIQEDIRRHEMNKLRMDNLLIRGIY